MSHPRKAILPIVLLALALGFPQGFAQSSGPVSDLKDGIDQFRNGQYDKAILLFHNVILDPNAGRDDGLPVHDQRLRPRGGRCTAIGDALLAGADAGRSLRPAQ